VKVIIMRCWILECMSVVISIIPCRLDSSGLLQIAKSSLSGCMRMKAELLTEDPSNRRGAVRKCGSFVGREQHTLFALALGTCYSGSE